MKTIEEIIKSGVIETEDDFNTFVRNSDSIETDYYNNVKITDVRIYLNKDLDIFCEIYADKVETEYDEYLESIVGQNIRYFANNEQYSSYSKMMSNIENSINDKLTSC